MSIVLMTGGTGFIGSFILKNLFSDESISEIVIITRDCEIAKNTLLKKNINCDKHIFIELNFKKILKLDNRDLKQILSCDKVYHIAACISLSNSPKIIDINFNGTKFILDLFISSGVKLDKFVFFSTAYAFGIRETSVQENWILEKPRRFRNTYEESKFLCEKLIYEYHKKYNLNYLIIRPSVVISKKYNSKSRPQTIFLFGYYLKQYDCVDLYCSINPVLNIVSVEKLVKVFELVEKNNICNKIINVVGENVPISVITNSYEKSFNVKVNLKKCSRGESIDSNINSSMPYLLHPQREWEISFLNDNNLNENDLDVSSILLEYFKDE
ncbi:MAG: SDR family oxidoreductase [Nanoarchaeales archaeon]|nr:SDR family oxidoreductase [Nanoarchaeales archaeon]